MYATSKLIIPPKAAQDSDFIPKIRICLRPSPSSEKSEMGCSVLPDNSTNSAVGNMGVEIHDSKDIQGEDFLGNVDKQWSVDNSRGKNFSLWGNVDPYRRDSVLTKISLKSLINKENFQSLPLESRLKLLNFLPFYDRSPPPSHIEFESSQSSGCERSISPIYWMHPTALNNEFLTKALSDYSTRQLSGEFDQRVGFRSGLRASVGNRHRYSSTVAAKQKKEATTESEISLTSDPTWMCVPGAGLSHKGLAPTGSRELCRRADGPRQRHQTATTTALKSLSGQRARLKYPGCKRAGRSVDPQVELISTRFRKRKIAEPAASTEVSRPTASAAKRLLRSVAGTDTASEAFICSQPSHRHSDNSLAGDSAISASPRPLMTETSEGLKQAGFHSTTTKQGFSHSSIVSTSTTCLSGQLTAVDWLPRPAENNSPSRPVAASMPPPRQTKTLASVREKLRAKRLLKESQRLSPQLVKGEAPVSLSLITSLRGAEASTLSDPATEVKHALSTRRPCPTTPLIEPPYCSSRPPDQSGSTSDDQLHPVKREHAASNSVQHSLFMRVLGSPTSCIQPVIASLRTPRVVLRPTANTPGLRSLHCQEVTRSDFSQNFIASGTETLPTPSQPTAPTKCTHRPPAAAQLLPTPTGLTDGSVSEAAANAMFRSPGSVAVKINAANSGLTNGSNSTTTRAFFVDGNNLSETLALLQSLNPQATVTQQQFLLIPSRDKSQIFLCRSPNGPPIAPTPKPPDQVTLPATLLPASPTNPSPEARTNAGGCVLIVKSPDSRRSAISSPISSLPLLLPATKACDTGTPLKNSHFIWQ